MKVLTCCPSEIANFERKGWKKILKYGIFYDIVYIFVTGMSNSVHKKNPAH